MKSGAGAVQVHHLIIIIDIFIYIWTAVFSYVVQSLKSGVRSSKKKKKEKEKTPKTFQLDQNFILWED